MIIGFNYMTRALVPEAMLAARNRSNPLAVSGNFS
jgi:hypothetical protein